MTLTPDHFDKQSAELLRSGRPAMVGRFGCTEMSCLHNYLEIGKAGRNPLDYITGRRDQWWWNKNIMRQMREWSSFSRPRRSIWPVSAS